MKKSVLLLVLILISIAMTVGAWPPSGQIKNFPGGIHGWDTASATWRPYAVSGDGGLAVGLEAGTDAKLTEIDLFVKPANVAATQTITLVANVNQVITSGLTAGQPRKFITLTTTTPNETFWVQFGSAAVIGSSMRCLDSVSIPMRGGVAINVIASTAFDIFVVEGGVE